MFSGGKIMTHNRSVDNDTNLHLHIMHDDKINIEYVIKKNTFQK